jgi:hypothetical protein
MPYFPGFANLTFAGKKYSRISGAEQGVRERYHPHRLPANTATAMIIATATVTTTAIAE